MQRVLPIARAVFAKLEFRLGIAPVLVRRVVATLAFGALEKQFDSYVTRHARTPNLDTIADLYALPPTSPLH